jgi:S-disulfanyl-L-cysteine oxidoreductase SoxD
MDKCGISMRKFLFIAIGTGALGLACILAVWSAEDRGFPGVGRSASEDEIRAWNIDVPSTGQGLPAGRGTVKQGAQVFAAKCAVCHGPTGTEGPKDKLVGGRGTLASPKPVRTIGSYWPYAPTLYDYINRSMPFNAPGSLTPEEIYSVVAWLLFKNEIVPEDAVIDAQTLPQVKMPNRDGFIPDQRPDVPSK